MKTNRERYPNTDDALAAFKKHKEDCKCDCTFDKWLKMPCEDDFKKALGDMPIGMTLMGMLAASIFANRKRDDESGEAVDGIECPLCHKKNGKIAGIFVPGFKCPDCGAVISNKEISDEGAFRKWFSQFSKKQD